MVVDALDSDHASINEGALGRVLRMRKWLVLSSFALILMDRGYLNFESLAKTLHITNVGKEDVHTALSLAAVFQAATLALLLVQLSETWYSTLRSRLEDDIFRDRSLKHKVEKAELELRSIEADPEPAKANTETQDEFGPVSSLQGARNRLAGAVARRRKMRRRYWTMMIPEALSDGIKILPTIILFFYALVWNSHFGMLLSPAKGTAPPSVPATTSETHSPPV